MSNKDRLFTKMIIEICAEEGVACAPFSYDWFFLLERGGVRRHIFGYKFELNSDTASRVCEDKAAAYELLSHAGVPAVEHVLFMSPFNAAYIGEGGSWEKLLGLLKKHGKLVCKANEGTGGNLVFLARTQSELELAANKIFNRSRTMAVCPFVEIRQEYRVILLDGDPKLIFSKKIPHLTGNGESTAGQLFIEYLTRHPDARSDFGGLELSAVPEKGERVPLHWKHNLGQGADAEPVEDAVLADKLTALARSAAACVGIRFASVDIVETPGGLRVLELNSGVMTENFAAASAGNYAKAKGIYREAIRKMFETERSVES